MKFLKKGKRPLIPDDTVVQKNGSQEYQKEKADKPKTETAIVKSILSKRLKKRLEDIEDIIQRAESPAQADWLSRDLADEIAVLREELRLLNSIPDVPCRVQRDNPKVIKIKELNGSTFELSLSRFSAAFPQVVQEMMLISFLVSSGEKQQKTLLTGLLKEHLSVWKVKLEQGIMRKMVKSTLLLKFGQISSKFFTNLTKKTRKNCLTWAGH